jgi:hypothetical protein
MVEATDEDHRLAQYLKRAAAMAARPWIEPDSRHRAMSALCRFCSLIPGLAVKLSTIILAGPTVLSAVGVNPPHDGVR